MRTKFRDMELDALRRLYETRVAELESKLLKGFAWKNVNALQRNIRRISMAMFKKLNRAV